MCGIVGFINLQNNYSFDPLLLIKNMINEVRSRGPDFQNHWSDKENQVYLGHTRLAIIDLTQRSNQPIQTQDGNWTIIFNGEIYNYEELKKSFENKNNLSGDTSVLVALIAKYGFESAIKKIEGMFAIAAWDRNSGKLFLSRDRMGEKPLYYSIDNNLISFGSNINSLKIIPNKNLNISQDSVKSYFKLNYIPRKKSIYKNIFKLTPGDYLEYNLKLKSHKINSYWNIDEQLKSYENNDVIEETNKILENSVQSHLVSDVEVGTLLSGGIDSSLITAISKKFTNSKIKTFTLGSDDYNFDESQKAKNISNYLGFENLNYIPSKNEILSTINDLPRIYGEPFGDSSQIPSILISKFAKNYVKVVLSGDGGDELFGGYNRYKYFHQIYPKLNFFPAFIRKQIGKIFKNLNPSVVDKLVKALNYFLPSSHKKYNYGYSLNKFGRLLECENYEDSFYSLICNPVKSKNIFVDQNDFKVKSGSEIKNIYDIVKHDLLNYLPDDILCKVDRASMAYGLEVRSPFLYRNVVELAQKIPFDLKFKNGESKFILKEILKKYLPKNLYSGPKRGFSVPISLWLKNDLKDVLLDYSSKSLILQQNIFNYETIINIINDHLNNKKNNEKFLWSYLVFQLWYFQNR